MESEVSAMARGFVRKAFYLALILLGVSTLCFALLRLSGRDPALAVALRAQSASEENIARLRKELASRERLCNNIYDGFPGLCAAISAIRYTAAGVWRWTSRKSCPSPAH